MNTTPPSSPEPNTPPSPNERKSFARSFNPAADDFTDKRQGIRSSITSLFTSPLARCGIIAFITFVLLIPLSLVESVVYDRHQLYREATDNIVESWGKSQTISGPALIVPYDVWEDQKKTVTVTLNDKEKEKEVIERVYFRHYKRILPNKVHFDAKLDPEIRYRGIYKQALYNAPVAIEGNFILPDTTSFDKNIHHVHWDKAWLAVGITDLKTISEEKPLLWNGVATSTYQPGTLVGHVLGRGFHTRVPLVENSGGTTHTFSLKLHVRGSGGIAFTPVGESTVITLAGTWPSPRFHGNLLPTNRDISDNGFTATWNISSLTRTYPQVETLLVDKNSRRSNGIAVTGVGNDESTPAYNNEHSAITSFTAAVDLHENVSFYRMILRAVKYGVLFIGVTFVALFAFEMITQQRMHLLQYGLVGVSMSLFYLILLSLAEHTDFTIAFMAATAVTACMNSLYIAAALQSKMRGLIMGILLLGIYGLLYSLLRMEDFSLLVGTGLVIAMMAVLMFVTRKLPQASA